LQLAEIVEIIGAGLVSHILMISKTLRIAKL